MTTLQLFVALAAFALITFILYRHIGFARIRDCYGMWFDRAYWTDYNTVEFFSYVAKVVIIVPGLIFGLQIWWLYWFTLLTSATLVWASYKKALPTLIGFNTVWIFISVFCLVKHLV